MTLSEYFKDTKFDSIRLVKIDVEGHEKELIEGALDLFKLTTPEIIIFELNESNQVPFWQEKLIKLLDSLQYKFFAILNTTFQVKLKKS